MNRDPTDGRNEAPGVVPPLGSALVPGFHGVLGIVGVASIG
jgi:hypothetical protein